MKLQKKVIYMICGLLLGATLGASFKPGNIDVLKTALAAVCGGTAGTTYGPVSDFDLSDLTHLDTLQIPSTCNAELVGIGSWNTGTIESLEETFSGARAFNQPLNGWDVSAVTSLTETFYGAQAFNQPLNGWDVSAVTDLTTTFYDARAFNQDLNGWDVSAVTSLGYTFEQALAFTQKLCWDMGAVTDATDTLKRAPLSASIHQLGSAECAECASASSATSTVVSTVGALAAVLAAAAVLA